MKDNMDLLVKRLGQLVGALEQKEFGTTQVDQDVRLGTGSDFGNGIDVSEPTDENQANYFSTGADRITVDETGDEWLRIDFGRYVKVVNIRTNAIIRVAFANPDRRGGEITVRPADSPFTIGSGDSPLGTGFMWVQKDPNASQDPGIEVIAYN